MGPTAAGLAMLLACVAFLAACDAREPALDPGEDPIALLGRAESAMAELRSYDQQHFAFEQADLVSTDEEPVWQLWDAEYRHESPDRLRMVVRTAVMGETAVFRHPVETLRIGVRAWTRDLPSVPGDEWRCRTETTEAEMPVWLLKPRPDQVAEYLGVETLRGRTAHVVRVHRVDSREGSPTPTEPRGARPFTPPPRDRRYWIDAETHRVLREESDILREGEMARTEVRTYGAFDSAPQIAEPDACVEADAAGSTP